jgi:hypothetical protein
MCSFLAALLILLARRSRIERCPTWLLPFYGVWFEILAKNLILYKNEKLLRNLLENFAKGSYRQNFGRHTS